MLRNLIYTLVAALLLWGIVVLVQSFLFSQPAKERDLAHSTREVLNASPQCRDNLVDFKVVKSTEYRCDTKGLTDARSAGRFAYNAMVLLMQRDNAIVKTGLDHLTIFGFEDDQPIFKVTYTYGDQKPDVTLMGRFEGQKYVPEFKGQSSVPHFSEPSHSMPPGSGPKGLA